LRDRGVAHPERNVVVVLGHDVLGELFGTTLARLRPWTDAELARLRRLAAAQGLQIAYAPGGPDRLEWAQLARAPSLPTFCSGYRLNVCPPTDDRPFFFNMTRLGDLGGHRAGYLYTTDPLLVLALTLAILLGLGLIALLAPVALVGGAARPALGSLGYFVWIGLGYLILEVVLIQRFVLFLGFPTYSLSIVLSSLLAFTGLGSWLTTRVGARRGRALAGGLTGAGLLAVALALGLAPLLRSLISLPFAARIAVTVTILAPLGIAMGTAMPIGLRRLELRHPGATPWAWAVNGIASVVASVLAVAIAIEAGFTVATLAAAACYGLALADALLGRWPARPAGGAAALTPPLAPADSVSGVAPASRA
jgi:hypothetical protein